MEINHEIAYILGAMRDGSFIQNKKYGINRIKIYQKNREWIERVSSLFKSSFGIEPKIEIDKRDDVCSLMVNSVSIFKTLIELSDYDKNQRE